MCVCTGADILTAYSFLHREFGEVVSMSCSLVISTLSCVSRELFMPSSQVHARSLFVRLFIYLFFGFTINLSFSMCVLWWLLLKMFFLCRFVSKGRIWKNLPPQKSSEWSSTHTIIPTLPPLSYKHPPSFKKEQPLRSIAPPLFMKVQGAARHRYEKDPSYIWTSLSHHF